MRISETYSESSLTTNTIALSEKSVLKHANHNLKSILTSSINKSNDEIHHII